MKKNLWICVFVLFSFACGKGWKDTSQNSIGPGGWYFVDGNGTAGLNRDSTKSAISPQLFVFSGRLYLTWTEIANGSYQIRVSLYNSNDASPSWSLVDGNQTTGLNKNTTKDASNPTLAQAYGKLYLAWNETSPDGAQQVRVSEFNGNNSSPAWYFADGGGTYGINFNTAYSATTPDLGLYQNKLYAAWSEATSGINRHIRVALFNGNSGAPSWSWVDANGSNGLAFDTSQNAINPHFVVHNENFILGWSESKAGAYLIRAAYYNGYDNSPGWSFMDGSADKGLNQNNSASSGNPEFIMHQNQLFAIWSEALNFYPGQIRVAHLGGSIFSPAWKFLDGASTTGINQDASVSAAQPRMLSHGGKLYATWYENNGTATQIRVKVFNDLYSNPGWSAVDGSQSYGINKASNKNAVSPCPISFENKIYIAWAENDPNGVSQIRVVVGK